MSCPCPECNNDWGGSCLYETIEKLKRERDEARADCEVKASYARIYAANFEQAEAALEVAREAFAFMYQYAGATDAPVQVLDNLVALAEGEPLVHPWNFPARSENDAYKRAILLERDIHDRDCTIAALREGLEDVEHDLIRVTDGTPDRWTEQYVRRERDKIMAILSSTNPGAKVAAVCPVCGHSWNEHRVNGWCDTCDSQQKVCRKPPPKDAVRALDKEESNDH